MRLRPQGSSGQRPGRWYVVNQSRSLRDEDHEFEEYFVMGLQGNQQIRLGGIEAGESTLEGRARIVVMPILKVTGDEVSVSDIRLAADSELFEKTPLAKYLSGVGQKLEARDRVTIMLGLAEVIRSDEHISTFETDYFDMVANALKATPSEIIGMIPE